MDAVKNGFTLAELLVTIMIIAILSAVSMSGMKGYRERNNFNTSAEQVRDEVLKAQNLSLAPGENVNYEVTDYSFNIFADGSYAITDSGGTKINEGKATGINAEPAATKFYVGTGAADVVSFRVMDAQNPAIFRTISVSSTGIVELQ
jgi:prepilin-type N-terminal cleavage/methylation domain-containing protein